MARRKKTVSPLFNLFSYIFITIGLTLFLFSLPSVTNLPIFASFKNTPEPIEIKQSEFEYPTNISVTGVIDHLLVIPVKVKNNNWPLTEDAALYMVNSGKVGQVGNIVIYGHNSQSVFGNLANAKIGDTITVSTNLQSVYRYKINAVSFITPDDVSILSQDDKEKITIYTCFGLFDSQRLVITGLKVV